ncbi:hypothetical protein HYH03_008105 [Edaphochlamys debaryana]|uniref:Uncharacterized protein n=1 Tax=Edaphochlamys debaryana TaxID=47281 RepID=A0A836BY93_9CHLO|nr:hypothetical protein HYH03_008105 [Edaphochlamys debaryana]|eukprot:KAG2493586.1 hypothetical protein HYH03_008105 [Edaphochlamys debaryana]
MERATSLAAALADTPLQLDDQTRSNPHGEKVKRGPDAPAVSPNVELVDASTDQVRPCSLAEAVASEAPVLDDKSTTPFHSTDKEGVHAEGGAAAGGGHGAS